MQHAHHPTTDDHAAHADVPHEHISPVKMYVGIWGALMVLTVVTVLAAQINLGPLNVPVALAIASVKAALVALFFMHLFYDDKFNAVVFLSALLFLGIFGGLTIIDPLTRGTADQLERDDFGPRMMRTRSDLYPTTGDPAILGAAADAIVTTQTTGGVPIIATPGNH